MNQEAACKDCGRLYSNFGLDIILPKSQWLQINPDGGGLLCGQCISMRADKLQGATVIHAIIEVNINQKEAV
jgi:hypothetical protein